MAPSKTPQETEIFNRYKKWLHADYIPPHIVENYNTEVKNLKKITKL